MTDWKLQQRIRAFVDLFGVRGIPPYGDARGRLLKVKPPVNVRDKTIRFVIFDGDADDIRGVAENRKDAEEHCLSWPDVWASGRDDPSNR